MSEEEEEVAEEIEQEVAEEQPQEGNSLFNALFEAADSEPEPDEVEEVIEPPRSLSEAVDEIAREPAAEVEPELEAEEVEPEGEVEAESVEPQRRDPKTTKKKKVKQVVDPDIEVETSPSYAFPEEDPDKEFVDQLLPEEKDIYDLAKFASSNIDGYEGKDAEFKDYFKKTKDYIEKRIQSDPHVDLADDEEYQTFINRNRPKLDQVDIKKIERERNVQEAVRRLEEKQAPEKRRAHMEQERAKKAPIVHGHKTEFRKYSTNAIPEEFSEVVKDDESIQKFSQENPLEFQIVNELTTELHNVGDLLLDITQGMVPYDEGNPAHAKLLGWVNTEQENFIQSGQTKQDGKTFMRRERYFRLPENKRAPFYTWGDADLLAILTMRAKQRITQSVGNQRQLLESSGYARQAQAAAKVAKPKAVRKRASPPMVSSKPRQGNSPSQTPNTPQKSAFESVLGL
jgi:hypothetical protein